MEVEEEDSDDDSVEEEEDIDEDDEEDEGNLFSNIIRVDFIQLLIIDADDSSDSAEAEEEKAGGEEEKGTELSMLLDNSGELTDVDKLAHTAEEYQPKGYTLSSTKVRFTDL